MKFGTQATLIIAAGIFSTATLATPLAVEVLSPRDVAPRVTPADRYPLSGLDYTTWSQKVVSEGKMTWPTTPPPSLEQPLSANALPWNLKSVACSDLGANKILHSAGEAQFCRLVRQYVGGVLHGAQVIMTNELCNGEGCVMTIEVSFGVGGAFVQHAIPEICEHLFEAIWRDCKGTGGLAELIIGSETGFVDASFFVDDTSATCPADTRTDVCRKIVLQMWWLGWWRLQRRGEWRVEGRG